MARSRSSLCQGLDRYRPKLTEYSCTVTPPCTYVNDLDFVAGAGGFIAEPGDGSARHTPARRPGERLCEIWAHVALVGWLEGQARELGLGTSSSLCTRGSFHGCAPSASPACRLAPRAPPVAGVGTRETALHAAHGGIISRRRIQPEDAGAHALLLQSKHGLRRRGRLGAVRR